MDRLTFPIRELKFASEDDPAVARTMAFSGYGAVFGNVDAHGDMIQPGAFAVTLAEAQQSGQWPAMLMQHGGWAVSADDLTPIGVWTSMAEDGIGLKVEGVLADTPRGREAYTLLKMQPRPAINGLSIGYIAKESVPRSQPEEPRRTLKRVDLIEVSLVTFPANRRARVSSVKSLEDIATLADAEAYLRESVGLTRTQTVGLIARIKAAALRDGASESPGGGSNDAALAELAAMLRKRNAVLAGG